MRETYHGSQSAEEYKYGEKKFRTYKRLAEQFSGIALHFEWVSEDAIVPVFGPVERFYRDERGIPHAELAYLEHDVRKANSDPELGQYLASLGDNERIDMLVAIGNYYAQLRQMGIEPQTVEPMGIVHEGHYSVNLADTFIYKGTFYE